MCWEQTPSSNTVRPVPSRHITGQHKHKKGDQFCGRSRPCHTTKVDAAVCPPGQTSSKATAKHALTWTMQLATGQACNNGVEAQMFKGQAQETNAAGNRPSMQQWGGNPNVQGTSLRNQRSWQQAKHATTGWNPKCLRDKRKKPTQLATGQACNNGVEPQMYKGQAQETNAAGNRPSMQQRGGTQNVQGTSPRTKQQQINKNDTAGKETCIQQLENDHSSHKDKDRKFNPPRAYRQRRTLKERIAYPEWLPV